jgi:hypothetical protein
MKNLTSLIVVLCLLIILGCKCQSDLFDSAKKDSPTPTATSSPKPLSASTPSTKPTDGGGRGGGSSSTSNDNSSDDSRLATGTYTGSGKNVTFNKTGDFLLRIDSVDADGNVKAYFEASNGLTGNSNMKGKISSDGKLTLSGTMDDGQSGAVSATVTGDSITAGYAIVDSKLKSQSGNFTVTRR